MRQINFFKSGLLFCLLLFSVAAIGQTGSLRGSVRDETNQPLPGATITLKGASKSASSDVNGEFKFPGLPLGPQTFVVSYIGYEVVNKQVTVAADTKVDFKLTPSTTTLAQVVVVGYGTQRKQDVTGSVSTINAKSLNPGPVTSPLQQIAGKAAGVNVTQVGSEPGSAPSVRIRGITSLMGGNDPLVVVDGIQGNMDLLNQIPPSEIESVDILKDASATAIYGSRGAPGVILVTTKKSKAGSTSVEYNAVSSVDVISNQLELLDANQWWTEAQKWDVPASNNHGANTDWFSLLTRNGTTQNHNLAIGGGSTSFNYRASLNAILQEGIVLRSNNKNYIGRITATQKALNDKLTVTMNLNSSFRNTTGSPGSVGRAAFTSNLISNAYVTRPTDPVFESEGNYFIPSEIFQPINPYAVAQTIVNEGKVNDVLGSLRADLEVIPGLTAGVFGSWRKLDDNWGYYLPAKSTITSAIENKGIAELTDRTTNEGLIDLSLNYKKKVGEHSVDVIGVYEWQKQVYQGNFSRAKGFLSDETTFNRLEVADLTLVRPGDFWSYKNDRTNISFLGRVNYSFRDRYLLTASMRRDGSSVFGANHKWGNFPSVSVAWRVDQEPFMAEQNILSSLKIRGGYGVTGNQQGLSPQMSLRLVNPQGTTYFGGSQIPNFNVTQNANPDLRWETKYQTNVGIDFAILNSRLSGTLDAFTATTKNLLFNYSVPIGIYEHDNIVANVGSVQNRGLEATLSFQLVRTDNTTLTLAGNGSLLKNKVLDLSGTLPNGDNVNTDYIAWGPNAYLIKDQPIGTFNILQHAGIDAETNKEVVVDQNSDGNFDQGNRSEDRVIAGQALPKYTYAFTPSFSHKNFDLSMVWRGAGGHKIYNSLRQSLSLMENIGKSNILKSAIPVGMYTTTYGSDFWLEKGDYLRFENLTLGYRFDLENLKYLKNLRVSFTANNLALITKYSGIDPELAANGGNTAGGDNGVYPRVRSFALGLNVTLK